MVNGKLAQEVKLDQWVAIGDSSYRQRLVECRSVRLKFIGKLSEGMLHIQQQRHEVIVGGEQLANAIALVGALGVAGVLAPGEVIRQQVVAQQLPADQEERPNDEQVVDDALARHAAEALDAGAAEETHEDRLSLVIGVVGLQHGVQIVLAHGSMIEVKPQRAVTGLQVCRQIPMLDLRAALDRRRQPQGVGQLLHEFGIARALSLAGFVVKVDDDEVEVRPGDQQVQQGDTVGPATDCNGVAPCGNRSDRVEKGFGWPGHRSTIYA